MTTETITTEIVTDEPNAAIATREIAAINNLHRLAHSAADVARAKAAEASHYAILAGSRLEVLKSTLPHGQWGRLFTDAGTRNLTANATQNGECVAFEFTSRTAERYINLVKNLRAEKSLSLKAQKRLSTIAEAPDMDDESRQWLEKLTEGRNLRQLYLDLEIITTRDPNPREPKPPAAPARIPKSEAQLLLEDARETWFLWREAGEKAIRNGSLDRLDRPALEELKEFHAWLRDRINARLKAL